MEQAGEGTPVTIQMDKEIDVSRGCVLTKDTESIVSNMLNATIPWMDDIKLVAGKSYNIKICTKMLPATVMSIRYKIDINSGEHLLADELYKMKLRLVIFLLLINLYLRLLQKVKLWGEGD